jgi:NTE family protein
MTVGRHRSRQPCLPRTIRQGPQAIPTVGLPVQAPGPYGFSLKEALRPTRTRMSLSALPNHAVICGARRKGGIVNDTHLAFTLVLAGGGARGFAHAGVLRALEHEGLRPTGIVGVSMGAVVGATYSLREDWYSALLSIDTAAFPSGSGRASDRGHLATRLRAVVGKAHTAWSMLTGWGTPESVQEAGAEVLQDLLGTRMLEEGRLPVTVCATDLLSGSRVEIDSGSAKDAAYASSALAGVLPPVSSEGRLLADGVYSDIAPIDIARRMEAPIVIAVDPSQSIGSHEEIHNGLQAVMRAMEICHLRHAGLRMDKADLVVRPRFSRPIDVLDFGARRECIAAGVHATRRVVPEIRALLQGGTVPVHGAAASADRETTSDHGRVCHDV